MESNPSGNEYERLTGLPVPELLKEYSEALDRFHEYLKKRGIEVPVVVASETLPEGSDPSTSVFLEEFTPASITAVNPSVITIYFNVKTFCGLLSELPESPILDEIMISNSEGKAPLPVKKYRERAKSGAIKDDVKLSMSTDDALSLIAELENAAKNAKQEKVATLDEADVEGVFDGAKAGEVKRKLIVHPDIAELPACAKLSYPMDFGPITITQDSYDKLFSNNEAAETVQTINQDQLDTIISTAKNADTEEEAIVEKKVDDNISQDDLNALMSQESILKKEKPEETIEEPEEAIVEEESASTVSQSDLDALFAGNKPSKTAPVETVIEEESSSVSQSDLDALFAGNKPSKTAPIETVIEEESSSVSQSDLDALFAGNKPSKTAPIETVIEEESSSVSQSDLDALFAGSKPAKSATQKVIEKEEVSATVSQNDLDALFDSNKPPVSKAEDKKTVHHAEKETIGISQNDIDKAFNQKSAPKTKEQASAEKRTATISQNELDELLKN